MQTVRVNKWHSDCHSFLVTFPLSDWLLLKQAASYDNSMPVYLFESCEPFLRQIQKAPTVQLSAVIVTDVLKCVLVTSR